MPHAHPKTMPLPPARPPASPLLDTTAFFLAKRNVPQPPEREQVPPPALQGPRRSSPLLQEEGHPPLAQRLPREEAAEGALDGASCRSSQPVRNGTSVFGQRPSSARKPRAFERMVRASVRHSLGVSVEHLRQKPNHPRRKGFKSSLSHLSSVCCFSTAPRANGAPWPWRNSRRLFRTLSCTRCLASTSDHLKHQNKQQGQQRQWYMWWCKEGSQGQYRENLKPYRFRKKSGTLVPVSSQPCTRPMRSTRKITE